MKCIPLPLALTTLAAAAQSTISIADRFTWAPNAGWIDFRPSAADGLVVNESTLSGRAWSPNLGWIYFGNGLQHHYPNTTAGSYGVNLAPDGKLTGFAWSPNAGWINFEQSHGQPRIDLFTGQISGSAWCPNIGWIAIDVPQSGLRTTTITIADTDNDGMGDAWEAREFGNLTAAGATTNADGDPASDVEEYRAGTLPNNQTDWLQIISQSLDPSGQAVTVRFTTSPGRAYRFEFCDDMSIGPWTAAGPDSFAPDAGPVTERTFAIPPGPRRFFRVTALRPLVP